MVRLNFDISSSTLYDESRGRYAYTETIKGQWLPYFFSPTCPKTKFREKKMYTLYVSMHTYSFLILTCPNPVLLVPGFGKWVSTKTGRFIAASVNYVSISPIAQLVNNWSALREVLGSNHKQCKRDIAFFREIKKKSSTVQFSRPNYS